MVLWETEFYALSVLTGNVECFRGAYIQANGFQEALKIMRRDRLDYLQLTGKWFADADAIESDQAFTDKLADPEGDILGMSYDDFMDWLDLAVSKEDLIKALDTFRGRKGFNDYVKILTVYLDNYDEEGGSKGGSEKEGLPS